MAGKATHEQAQLQLKLYDLRREEKLRQARDWFVKNYWVDSFEDAMKLGGPGTEHGTYVMMVLSYWEQACSMLNQGLLHEDLFFENTGEFFGVFERVRGVLPQFREKFINKHFLANMEQAANQYEAWMEKRSPGNIAGMRQWMKTMRPPQAGKAVA
ncbi:MAG: hypothetical protein WAL41_03115 [Mycobacterium sp.]